MCKFYCSVLQYNCKILSQQNLDMLKQNLNHLFKVKICGANPLQFVDLLMLNNFSQTKTLGSLHV